MRLSQCLGVLLALMYPALPNRILHPQQRTTIRIPPALLEATKCKHASCTGCEPMLIMVSTMKTNTKTRLLSAMHRIVQHFHSTSGSLPMIRDPFTATLRVSDQGTTIPCAIARLIRILACLLETPAGTCHLNMMALSLVLGIMRQSQAIT
jgi:hypothetical protein